MRKVAVFFGGKSCESEISVLTGVMVLNLLDKNKYTIFPVYVHTNGLMYTSPDMFDVDIFQKTTVEKFQRIFFEDGTMYALNDKKRRIKPISRVDVALNCCHGGLGEGGGVSALMEWNEIPLASPDLTASGVFMDKGITKLVLQSLNIPTVEYIRVNEGDYRKRGAFLLKRIEPKLKYPVVVKPARLGSSIGITLAHSEEELKDSLETAFALDERVVIEKYLPNKTDVNCAAYMLHGEIVVSEPEKAFGEGIYSFEDKYVKGNSDANQSANKNRSVFTNEGGMVVLTGVLRDKIRAYTKTVYKRMNLRGVVRMDFLVSEGNAYLCEVNTVPGSLAYYLFCERLTDARLFLGDILEEAIIEAEKGEKKILHTGILKNIRKTTK